MPRRRRSPEPVPVAASKAQPREAAPAQKSPARKKSPVAGEVMERLIAADLDNDARASVRTHPHEITPAHRRGHFKVGSRIVSFRYEGTGEAGKTHLVLEIPEGVRAVFVPVETPSQALHVEDPGGGGARTVRISIAGETVELPRVQATFTCGSDTYIVTFHLAG